MLTNQDELFDYLKLVAQCGACSSITLVSAALLLELNLWTLDDVIGVVALSVVATLVVKFIFDQIKDLWTSYNLSALIKLANLSDKNSLSCNTSVSPESSISNNSRDNLVHQTKDGNYKYWLRECDIASVAQHIYKYSTDSDHDFNIVSDLFMFYKKLLEYKNRTIENQNLIFISIINLGGNHWVTLVIKKGVDNRFMAYYYDSFGSRLEKANEDDIQKIRANALKKKQLSDEISRINEERIQREEDRIKNENNEEIIQSLKKQIQQKERERMELPKEMNSAKTVPPTEKDIEVVLQLCFEGNYVLQSRPDCQQFDIWNCGIFALESAKKITEMFENGETLESVDIELKKSLSLSSSELKKCRESFSRKLSNNPDWQQSYEDSIKIEDICSSTNTIEAVPSTIDASSVKKRDRRHSL